MTWLAWKGNCTQGILDRATSKTLQGPDTGGLMLEEQVKFWLESMYQKHIESP